MATYTSTLDLYKRQRLEVRVSAPDGVMPMVRLTTPGGSSVSLRLDELQAATRFAWAAIDGRIEPDSIAPR